MSLETKCSFCNDRKIKRHSNGYIYAANIRIPSWLRPEVRDLWQYPCSIMEYSERNDWFEQHC